MHIAPGQPPHTVRRSFLIDAVKASGCLLIVLHHLAFYGPMSDVAANAWPRVLAWLYDYGRLAVQFFLVCAGYLTAASLARFDALTWQQALKLCGQRYLRLAIPLLAALSFTVLVTEGLRPDFDHASLSATPDWGQALAHIVFLQHGLGMEALSAGIWYVAIDFQLYAMTLLSLVAVQLCRTSHMALSPWAVRWGLQLGLTCASLWYWNLNAEWEDLGLYFFGSYGLGLLAWEGQRLLRLSRPGHDAQRWAIWAVFLVMGGLAFALEPRWRIATAWLLAGVLLGMPERLEVGHNLQPLTAKWRRWVEGLSTVSYAVFLMHFGVSLLVNAAVYSAWPERVWANTLGMLLALTLSVASGVLLHRWVERPSATWSRWCLWAGVFKASVALAWLLNPGV